LFRCCVIIYTIAAQATINTFDGNLPTRIVEVRRFHSFFGKKMASKGTSAETKAKSPVAVIVVTTAHG
jgi:hypothetical protein